MEDTVIAALKSDKEIKDTLCNTVKAVPVTLNEISGKAENDAFVEKRKISYFGLARNLIRHLISPNQDDLSYSARTFISG